MKQTDEWGFLVEVLETEVVDYHGENNVPLRLEYDGDCSISFVLDGKLVFSGDWTGNLRDFFEVALEQWPEVTAYVRVA